MLIGCTLPPVPSPPGGFNGSWGFCSSAIDFSLTLLSRNRHTAGAHDSPFKSRQMSAKCLHLQVLISQRIKVNYSTSGQLDAASRADRSGAKRRSTFPTLIPLPPCFKGFGLGQFYRDAAIVIRLRCRVLIEICQLHLLQNRAGKVIERLAHDGKVFSLDLMSVFEHKYR